MPSVAERLAQCLVANGVNHVFCVPGESYLALLDALGRLGGKIEVVACRHEAGAANMAVAYGKLTGKPGICMVTRGPGATHASIGVHTAGDGCFLMGGQELATAVQYGAAIVIVVVDNGSYGTIRMHQERDYPGRVVATDLRNPDFAAYARAFGGWGETVETTADFADAFRRAQASGLPAVIHVRTALDDIAPGQTIAQIRAAAKAR